MRIKLPNRLAASILVTAALAVPSMLFAQEWKKIGRDATPDEVKDRKSVV